MSVPVEGIDSRYRFVWVKLRDQRSRVLIRRVKAEKKKMTEAQMSKLSFFAFKILCSRGA